MHSINLKKIFNTKHKKTLILIAILIVAAVFVALLVSRLSSNDPAETEVLTHSTDTPDEKKPSEEFKWRGSPNDPKYIKLPSIGAEGYIQNVGIDQNKEVAVPNNIHMAGWFTDSVRPGEKGLSIIDGHLNGRSNAGIFENLEKIEKDATYTVEFGDGTIKEFKVIGVKTVNTNEAASVLFSQEPTATNQLNLVTCGGNFDPAARLYDKRVIVSSVFINN